MHLINVLFSIIFGNLSSSDQCGLYFITIFIDVTLGTFISFSLLYGFDQLMSYKNSKRLKSGNYFKKVVSDAGKRSFQIDYCVYALQTLIWCGVVFLMKFIITSFEVILSGLVTSMGDGAMKM